MRKPPQIRGGSVARWLSLVFGLAVFSCGIVAFLESKLGLPPWDVLHQGIARWTPLSFGSANVIVGLAVLAAVWALGAHVGAGTIANALLIGVFVIALLRIDVVGDLSQHGLATRVALLVGGLALFGVGSAFYIGAAMGAGPRDSLMLVGWQRTGVRVGAVRAAIEASALVLGFALGGTVGVGTLAFALLIGPAVEGSFWLLARSPLVASPA